MYTLLALLLFEICVATSPKCVSIVVAVSLSAAFVPDAVSTDSSTITESHAMLNHRSIMHQYASKVAHACHEEANRDVLAVESFEVAPGSLVLSITPHMHMNINASSHVTHPCTNDDR